MTKLRQWTSADKEWLRQHYPDTPTDECAAYLGRTTIAARRCAGKMRLKKSPQFMATVRYGAEFWERGRQ